jgi:two-component system, OmpR family, KDP operon response regulator KdpE
MGPVEMPRILVVDDDPLIRDLLGEGLPLQWPGVTVVTASDGDEALRVFLAQQPDVVILNVALPDLSGFEVLRQIRQNSDAPVILLTGRDDETDQIRGFQVGADDYLVKSLGINVLTARIRAVLRRTQPSPRAGGTPDLEVGPLTLSFDRHEVFVQGRSVHLTSVEFSLLYHLARNAGQVLTYEILLTRIWGADSHRAADHLRVYVSRLLSKIEHAGGPRCIENERGLGYRLVRPPPPR